MEYQVWRVDTINGSFLNFTIVLRAKRDTERRVRSSCIGKADDVFWSEAQDRLTHFNVPQQFFTKVQMEDYELCEKTQRNLNAGIYETGICERMLATGLLTALILI